MHIEGVRLVRAVMPRVDPRWRTASYAATSMDGFALEVEAGGHVGVGATVSHPSSLSGDELQRLLAGPVRQTLLGADVYEGVLIRRQLREQGVHSRAIMAADLALHDLLGRMAGVPCYALWGGRTASRLDVVRMVGIKPPAELQTAVRGLVEQGLSHFKIKLGTGLDEDEERIATLRKAFGSSIWIGVDGNGAYSVDDAIALSRRLADHDVKLLEQPINYEDIDGLARLTAASPIPVMADQNVFDVPTALEICRRKAAHVVSVKAIKMGSMDECRRVAEMCLEFGVDVHVGGSAQPATVDMAQAHLVVSVPGIHLEAEVGESQAVTNDPTGRLDIRDGGLELGTAPGFGLRPRAAGG
jgi:L-Ala-D/L-Glu epimerase